MTGATGRVSWARGGSIAHLSGGRIGMGVKFNGPPALLVRIVEEGG